MRLAVLMELHRGWRGDACLCGYFLHFSHFSQSCRVVPVLSGCGPGPAESQSTFGTHYSEGSIVTTGSCPYSAGMQKQSRRLEATTADNKRTRQRGHAVLEISFFLPWIIFLFTGALDCGFYSYALINTENAARVAVMQTSTSAVVAGNSTVACTYVLAEMQSMSNLGGLSSCGSSPLVVTATSVSGASSADGAAASKVSVTYTTSQLIPFPGMAGTLTITRTAQMRVKGS